VHRRDPSEDELDDKEGAHKPAVHPA